MAIARAKCEALLPRLIGDAVVVTADTVAVCNGEVREKPADAAELRRFVESYSEHPVMAVTAVYVHRLATGWSGSAVDTATVHFRRFTDTRIDSITEDPAFYGSAGGFLIEHPLMRQHVRFIDGDPDTVQGFPGRLARLLVADALTL
jgi:septum formation protein